MNECARASYSEKTHECNRFRKERLHKRFAFCACIIAGNLIRTSTSNRWCCVSFRFVFCSTGRSSELNDCEEKNEVVFFNSKSSIFTWRVFKTMHRFHQWPFSMNEVQGCWTFYDQKLYRNVVHAHVKRMVKLLKCSASKLIHWFVFVFSDYCPK